MVATHRLMPYAAVLAAALTLGACSGGDPAPGVTGAAPTAVGTSTGTPTSRAPSPSPTSTKVEDPVLAKIPKAARAKTQEGAEAFVKFFMNSLNTAATKPDPDVLKGLYDKGCKTCMAMQDSIVELKDRGERYDAASLTVRDTSVLAFGEAEMVIRVRFDEKRVNVVNRTGQRVGHTKPASTEFAATITYRDTHWVILKLQRFGS